MFAFQRTKLLQVLVLLIFCLTALSPYSTSRANPESTLHLDIKLANCYDGIDNDEDGQTDWPNDPQCQSASDNSESSLATISFSGWAYPLSPVTILKDGQIAVTTIAGPDAKFNVFITGLTTASYTFGVLGEDSSNRNSKLFSFTVYLSEYTSILVSGIYLSPTVDTDKEEIMPGDNITIIGETVPNSNVTISLHSSEEHILNTITDGTGRYAYTYNTTPLEVGMHTVKSKSAKEIEVSDYGESAEFLIIGSTITVTPTPNCRIADLNCDGKVNLIDFSIEAYWYARSNPPVDYDLNHDNKIDLIDFSVMAYYWTG